MNSSARHELTGVTRHTLRFIKHNLAQYQPLFFIAAGLYALIGLFSASLEILGVGRSGSAEVFAVSGVESVLFAVVSAMIAVPLHNKILGGAFRGQAFVAANTIYYWLVETVLFAVFIGALFALQNLASHSTYDLTVSGENHGAIGSFWSIPILLVMLLFVLPLGVYYYTSIVTLLPHIAITPTQNIRWTWAFGLSKNYFWRIFIRFAAVGLITTVPFTIISIFVVTVLFESLETPNIVSSSFEIAFSSAFNSATVLFYISMASFIFLRLSNADRKISPD